MIPNGGSAKPTEPTAKEASETESSLFASDNSKSSVGNACQSPEIPTKDREKAKEPKEIGLKTSQNSHKAAVAQEIEHIQENAALLKQIEKMRANPRKVTQITIYYDDSTFETFYPGGKDVVPQIITKQRSNVQTKIYIYNHYSPVAFFCRHMFRGRHLIQGNLKKGYRY